MQKLNKKGFTIIEVLIVLAIAGLILLVVFLAVPALQRNSRNTQKRQSVAQVLSMVSEYQSNNNGALPSNAASDPTNGYVCMSTSTISTCNPNQTSYMGQIGPDVNVVSGTVGTTVGLQDIVLVGGQACDVDAGGHALNPQPRALSALFVVEGAGTNDIDQCQQT